jgi:hypothetical protein
VNFPKKIIAPLGVEAYKTTKPKEEICGANFTEYKFSCGVYNGPQC